MELREIVNLNTNFKNAINLYLNLNKDEKVQSYIPTKSSVDILKIYLDSVEKNSGKASILIGPYGKGKSHLILVLLALLSKGVDELVIQDLLDKISVVDKNVVTEIKKYLKSDKRILPVIIPNAQDDLKQTFMVALNDALKRAELTDVMPDTFFSEALKIIENWKTNYKNTYNQFCELLRDENITIKEFNAALKECDSSSLSLFKKLYPQLTSGSEFNPLAGGDVLIMYKSVAETIQDYGYSGMFIVFDEFSKYIESQDNKSSGKNMELIQQICELSDESKDQQIFITLIAHKAIKEYEGYLSRATINAFLGIEGRIREIDFVTSSKNNYELIKNALGVNERKLKDVPEQKEFFGKKVVDEYYSIPTFESSFLREDFERIVVRGCYPLNPLSAYTLLNISERVAQNERTLFTFISKDERYSLAHYVYNHTDDQSWIIGSDYIYDYFKSIFKQDASEESIHNEWLNAEYAIKKAETDEERVIVKTIAILNIINKIDEVPSTPQMIRLASGVSDAESIVSDLENKKIIYQNMTSGCYRFKTRAGATLKKEIQKRRELKQDNIDYSDVLLRVSDKKYLLPKQYNYKYSMTRYFNVQFMQTEDFLKLDDLSVIFDENEHLDGKVFALYSLDPNPNHRKKILKLLQQSNTQNVVVVVSDIPFTLTKQALDYEIIQELQDNVAFMNDNEVLAKELLVMKEDLEAELSGYVDTNFWKTSKSSVLFYDGEKWTGNSGLDAEKAVDASCCTMFNKTLRINNELINKQFITTAPIKKARKAIIDGLLAKNINDEFVNGTGPESTIYRAVILNTGIGKDEKSKETKHFLDLFTRYLNKSVEKKNPLINLTKEYYSAPFGMRAGVLPIILAYVFSYRNEDVIVYEGDKETDLNSDTIIRMCDNPDSFSVYISKEDAQKEEYLKLLVKSFDQDCYTSLTGTRISNVFMCMQRWYRSLPQVTKNIQNDNPIIKDEKILNALPKFRRFLQSAEGNAYEILFVSFPEMFGTKNDLKGTAKVVASVKEMLNSYYDKLLSLIVSQTIKEFGGKSKDSLLHTLKEWYEKQSDNAKNGLQDSSIIVFMNTIKGIDTFDETEIVQKVAKVVSGVYVDAWDANSLTEYGSVLHELRLEIEGISNNSDKGGNKQITLVDTNGTTQHRFYQNATDPSAGMLKNILSDTLEDFSNMSLNDRVAVLTDILKEIMNKDA